MLSGTCNYKGHLGFLWIVRQTGGLGRQPALMGHELKLKLGQVGRWLGLQSGEDKKVQTGHQGLECRREVRIIPFSNFQ